MAKLKLTYFDFHGGGDLPAHAVVSQTQAGRALSPLMTLSGHAARPRTPLDTAAY